MAYEKFEFYCSGSCSKYFDFVLNTALNGDYRIHCPNCKHIHYRTIKDGQITETRHGKGDSILIEDLYPMKSSCRDTQKEKEEAVAQTRKGFLSRLWDKTVHA